MWWLALRNLLQSKARLVVATGGVALSLLLILALDAILAGTERQVTAYIDNSGADIIVSQEDVYTMHMSSSALLQTVAGQVASVPGVAEVSPIHYLTNVIEAGGEQHIAYVIGLYPDARTGTPWKLAEGSAVPRAGEAIIDRVVARHSGVSVGDRVSILGTYLTVTGLSEGTVSMVNSVAFISAADFIRLSPESESFSYLLVTVNEGTQASAVAERIERDLIGVTAQTAPDFARQERQLVRDMSTDIVAIMNSIGFLIGLAVLALTTYSAILSRRAEYGVLKALGARNRQLYRVVLVQTCASVLLGFMVGLVFVLLLAQATALQGSTLALDLRLATIVKVGIVSILIAALAAALPVKQIAGLDPAMVFRGASR